MTDAFASFRCARLNPGGWDADQAKVFLAKRRRLRPAWARKVTTDRRALGIGRPDRRRASVWTLLVRFTLASIVPLAALGVVLVDTTHSMLVQQVERDTTDFTNTTTVVALRMLIPPSTATHPLTPSGIGMLDVAMGKLDSGLLQVDLVNRTGAVVYSSDHALIGHTAPRGPQLARALAGHVVVARQQLDGHDPLAPNVHATTATIWLPVRFHTDTGPADLVAVVYRPYSLLAASADHYQTQIVLIIGIGMALLWLVLIRIVYGVSVRLRRQAAANEWLALHDPLTELPNRTLFGDRLDQAIAATGRSGATVAVLLMDLDRFKEINDSLGHHFGDELLRQVAARMQRALRPADTIARLGGDEFGIVLPDLPDAAAAEAAVTRLLGEFRAPFSYGDLTLPVESSFGIALYPEDGDSTETLMQRADVAMYAAKSLHRGYRFYTAAEDTYSADRLALVSELRHAIDTGQLTAYYQPKARLHDGSVYGMEALVRWRHPERGIVPPDQFIPLAEHTGLIVPLTSFVLDEALGAVRRWEEAGHRLSVSVNLSAKSLMNEEIVTEVADALHRHDLEPGRLELEVTESMILVDPGRAVDCLLALRQLGVQLSIDDFGSGYASLGYLRRLPLDKLKIDKSFVMNLANAEDAVIVRATVEVGRSLGLTTIAEGVETPEVWDQLVALGCDEAQGYLLSRPLPPEEVEAFLAASAAPVTLAPPALEAP